MAAKLRRYSVTMVNPKTIDDAGMKTEDVSTIGGSMKSVAMWMETMNPGWICVEVKIK